jgi:hypothetical protein
MILYGRSRKILNETSNEMYKYPESIMDQPMRHPKVSAPSLIWVAPGSTRNRMSCDVMIVWFFMIA